MATQAEKASVLFLCTGNSCRSQMADGLTRAVHPDTIEPYSAGIETHGLNPNAVAVMAELGIDISHHRSQHVDEFKDTQLDCVITVCDHAHEHCPLFPGRVPVRHASFEDPPKLAQNAATDQEALDCYRRVRDQIKDFVQTLPDWLKAPAA